VGDDSNVPIRIIAIAVLLSAVACSPSVASVRMSTETGDVVAHAEVADSDEERARGLMGRAELGSGDGMLFVYEEASTGTFWMRDTLIPLSIAFWDEDGSVHTILEMEPCEQEPCPSYAAAEPFVYALEMNAGWFDRNGVEVGDHADVELLTY